MAKINISADTLVRREQVITIVIPESEIERDVDIVRVFVHTINGRPRSIIFSADQFRETY